MMVEAKPVDMTTWPRMTACVQFLPICTKMHRHNSAFTMKCRSAHCVRCSLFEQWSVDLQANWNKKSHVLHIVACFVHRHCTWSSTWSGRISSKDSTTCFELIVAKKYRLRWNSLICFSSDCFSYHKWNVMSTSQLYMRCSPIRSLNRVPELNVYRLIKCWALHFSSSVFFTPCHEILRW